MVTKLNSYCECKSIMQMAVAKAPTNQMGNTTTVHKSSNNIAMAIQVEAGWTTLMVNNAAQVSGSPHKLGRFLRRGFPVCVQSPGFSVRLPTPPVPRNEVTQNNQGQRLHTVTRSRLIHPTTDRQ